MEKKKSTRKKRKFIKTTISLPEDLWKELKIETVEKKKTLSKLIEEKLIRLKVLEMKSEKDFNDFNI